MFEDSFLMFVLMQLGLHAIFSHMIIDADIRSQPQN